MWTHQELKGSTARWTVLESWRTIIITLAAAILIVASVGSSATAYAAAASDVQQLNESQAETLGKILPLVGGALVDIGRDDHDAASQAIIEASSEWKAVNAGKSDLSAKVDEAFDAASQSIADSKTDPAAAKKALAALASAVNAFKKAAVAEETLSGPDAAVGLVPTLRTLLGHIEAEEWSAANADYRILESAWAKSEQPIRDDNTTVYGSIETSISMIRIDLRAEPPRADQAKAETDTLISYLNDYAAGKLAAATSSSSDLTVADLIAVLDQATALIQSGSAAEAEAKLQSFITMWPNVEGQVSIRSSSVYRSIENEMTEAPSYLVANPPQLDKAESLIEQMKSELKPFVADAKYTAWDAGAILFREGLEAILVLAALLSYLKKTGNQNKRGWVWSGVWSGFLISGVMALVLTYVVTKASSGSTREMIEGYAGLGSVILMLTVGSWLHGKANLQAWNQYIDRTMGAALRRGSLWSLFAVSCLAIAREGAETTIFYIGMAPSIAPGQLALGFGVTFALLIALGYFIITFSVKLPIRMFFLTASVLIYYLVFRFLGESIHSLQVAGTLPSHHVASVPAIDWLGIYPTWETVIPQLAVLAYIAGQVLVGRKRTARIADVVSP
ncbi:high-affinity iron transporter [Paenibacillus cellulosilyticus]|uniref:High-affinity iron transporter n=1 Tax=Paenibacillus cellulosilyticus TaxID=375489 RepID=A0A2V2YV18_9BACL|nr:FTR1 family protein [Paenibacillus cellulosilyticus]PWV94275.1 high-affinity iron transporter [Paenibacillus cellulosilyticus]QKS44241.1 FTR1 family protein [Paenibacillus cellulosilyticus]